MIEGEEVVTFRGAEVLQLVQEVKLYLLVSVVIYELYRLVVKGAFGESSTA